MLRCRKVVITVCWKAIFVVALILAISANAEAAHNHKRVLLISSYHPGFPTFFQQTAGIKSTFDPLFIDLDIEFMDSKRFYSTENLNNFYNALHYKLSRTESYDVIMTADDNALSFALRHKQALFDKTPIVFFGVNSVKIAVAQNSNPDVTGIVEAVSMRETIDLMIKLHPNIGKIIALVDGTPSGQGDLETFYELQPVFKSVVFSEISLVQYTFEEFADQLRNIDENSVVLLLSAYRDKNDQSMDFRQSLALIRSNLSRPVYHLWDHGIGDGLLGGKIISHYHQGKRAAELVADILQGKDPKDIPVVTESPNHYKFDYNELKRFNIKLAALPSENTIINLPDTFYTRHKSVLWIGFVVVIGFSVIVGTLSINILRRKRAERDLQKAHDELDQKVRDRTVELREANKDLQNEIQERERVEVQLRHQAQIIRQVHDSVISTDMEGAITSWNKGSERLFLYTEDEVLGRHVALVYPEESHVMLHEDIIPTLLSRGSHGYETTLIKKGGEEFTALVSLSLLTDENGEHAGMIGYTLDITDAKNLEQEREQLITKLEDALAEVKTLSGLLPICASCKKIRDDKGYWNQIESYISRHSKAEFSHSICPECAKKLYPNICRHLDKQG